MAFDVQADRFDDYAGLEPAAGLAVARAIIETGCLCPEDVILDIGAGTGAIGRHFAALAIRYLGLDLSRPMLDVFQEKLPAGPGRVYVAQASCNRLWPVGDRAVALVFASRVLHLLEVDHIVPEVVRVCRKTGCLLIGRVERAPGSLSSRLRQQKRKLVAERGLPVEARERCVAQVLDELCQRGAGLIEPRRVAQWSRTRTPRQILSTWAEKPLLSSASRDEQLDSVAREHILRALAQWAQRETGDLDRPESYLEEYIIEGVRLP
jgi:ubiquinone/menaquinone biosynthesis C-methylase UbiE